MVAMLGGCATRDPGPAELFRTEASAASYRETRTRRLEGVSEAALLAASVDVLQDFGFRIIASDTRLGLVIGAKSQSDFTEMFVDLFRDALKAGFSLGSARVHPPVPYRFGATVVTRPADPQGSAHDVRVVFQRVWYQPPHETVVYAEAIDNPTLYMTFFARLAAAVSGTGQAR